MIVRATSDLHISQHTAAYVWEALAALKTDAAETGGLTVLCGDIFDQGLTAHVPTYNHLRDLLSDWGGTVHILAGNHDQYSGTRNILEGLAGPSHVRVISTPHADGPGLFIPYCKPEAFPAALATADEAGKRVNAAPYVWCHHGFKGAYVNAMRRDIDGVPFNAIPENHVAISGHYHMPQNIASLIYCGSPYEVSFHEEGQRKGWLRWDAFDFDRAIAPTRIAYDLSAPRHYTVRWDPKNGPPVAPVGMRDHDIVRVVADASRAEVQAAAKQLESVGLQAAPVLVQPVFGSGPRPVVNPLMPLSEVIQRYAFDRYATDNTAPEIEGMHAWAERVQLWAGL